MGRQEKIARSQAQWAAVDWEDVATFIGPNAKTFERMWRKLNDAVAAKGYGNVTSFCWPAFFFSFAWFFARKQWAAGATLLILPIAIGLIFKDMPSGALIGVSVAVAMLSKSLYLQTAMPKIARIVEETAPGRERDDRLRAAGGLSIPGLIGGGLLFALFIGAAVMAIMEQA